MTVPISPHKATRILREYLKGEPQTAIARRVGVDQSTVSHYASRFQSRAARVGIPAAAKEYGVLNEVEALRRLSVELQRSGLTIEDARQGLKVAKAFLKLGIGPEKHVAVVKVWQKAGEDGFVDAALKLAREEAKSGLSYEQVMSRFERALEQLPQLEENVDRVRENLRSANIMFARRKQEIESQEEHSQRRSLELRKEIENLQKELQARMRESDVEKNEVAQVVALKSRLAKVGLDLETLLRLAEEFSNEEKAS